MRDLILFAVGIVVFMSLMALLSPKGLTINIDGHQHNLRISTDGH